ncbi:MULTISPECIES: 50S ribosomal protein bL37 [Bifidobacteriaceae]|uniref:50S ribosomal protein bL37 n=1 Tax=Alloscardovia venturai TaxID=1769421 RepID=A0ABW2Y799_9BIFI
MGKRGRMRRERRKKGANHGKRPNA